MDADRDDVPPGWEPAPERGSVVGPTGDREPEPGRDEDQDGEWAQEHRAWAERLEGNVSGDGDILTAGTETGRT
jgi:hypothetical protein